MYEGPEFRHLKYFVAVAEECNFGKAARKLNVSQPALSTQIKQLEEGMHAQLFVRTTSGVMLTPAGHTLLASARQMLQMRRLSAEAVSSIHSGVDLPLRFGYSPFVNHDLVEDAFRVFRELVPDGKIEPSSECSGELVTMVCAGHLEAALVSLPIGEHDLFVHAVRTEQLLVCLRRDDPLAAKEILPIQAIQDRLKVIVNRDHHPAYFDYVVMKFAKAGIRLQPSEFVSSPGEMQFLVKTGNEYGLVRESTQLDPELTTRRVEGLSCRIKTAFICRSAQQRPVLPLLAHQLSKADMDGRKRPIGRAVPDEDDQLRIFA